MKKQKPRNIKAWAVVKNNKLSAYEIFTEKNVILNKGERIVRVIISAE